jgi:hypothetical protein
LGKDPSQVSTPPSGTGRSSEVDRFLKRAARARLPPRSQALGERGRARSATRARWPRLPDSTARPQLR